jgi:germination protein M
MKKKKLYKNNTITGFLKKAALGMVVCCALIGLLFAFSCTLLEDYPQVSGNDNDTNDTVEKEDVADNDKDTDIKDEDETGEKEDNDKEESEEVEAGDITINVYYSDDMGQYLVGETRTISTENKYVEALEELMKLPADSSLHRLVPETTKINSVTIENSLAKVDLSEEFIEDRFQSDTVDIMLIYSIVNTLTEFHEVNSVSLYIDGEKLDILGQLAIDEPIFRRGDLIKE